ncbi:MAG: putative amino acid transporter [Pseudonocardiales bacterium]|nr:putative amino acid transporter [Pseudonocardiales bacterium]
MLPFPLGGGSTFQCNGKVFPLSKNVCILSSLIAQAAEDGSLSNYKVYNDPTIYKSS